MGNIPGICRIVRYRLGHGDAEQINRRRKDARDQLAWHREHKTGAQIHVGNEVKAGDVFPGIIVAVHSEVPTERTAVNLQVFLDGNDLFWATSTSVDTDPEGNTPSYFTWPNSKPEAKP